MRELSLFSGAGGGLLGTKLLGFTHVGYVEYNDYCQRVIRQRIEDGILDEAPIFGDVRTFISEGYADSYQGMVDVITAGFPCQPFSITGNREGENDERNKWPETITTIRLVRPSIVFLENVTGLFAHEYARTIFRDLAESGYECRWRVLSSAEMGAPHKRDRIWIVAYTKSGVWTGTLCGHNKNSRNQSGPREQTPRTLDSLLPCFEEFEKRVGQPAVFRMDNGLANRVDRLKAVGNGQDPRVVQAAWQILTGN